MELKKASNTEEKTATARKSTTTIAQRLVHSRPPAGAGKQFLIVNKLNKQLGTSTILADFNPDDSRRERRKLKSKLHPSLRSDTAYDKFGYHIDSSLDVCDCMFLECEGCFFPCTKCASPKCGLECRCNRRFIYEEMEFQGCVCEPYVVTNPLKNYLSTF